MLEDLKDKVILVTGSSQGIGFATAKLLHSLGATVILNSRSEADLKAASEKLAKSPFYVCDLTNESDVKAMIGSIITDHGRIDGLVNNAGGGGWASITDPDDEWQKSFNLDLMAAVHTCRYALPHMKLRNGGVVVNVSSLWGISHTAKPSIASYCCAKAALSKLTEVLAQEYAPTVRVNAVAPGWTKTRMILDDFDENGISFMENNVLLKRLAEPDEIAQAIIFLLSNMSSYLTGQVISADGGYVLNRDNIDR